MPRISSKRLYTVAVVTIIMLVCISQLLIQLSIKDQEKDAMIINIAGRQRMLSQNIAKQALLLNISSRFELDTEDSIRTSFRKLLFEWKKAHLGLQHGDSSLSLPGKNSPEVQQLFGQIDTTFQRIHHAGSGLIASNDYHAKLGFTRMILMNEGEYLEDMNNIVKQYEVEANQKLRRLRFIEFMLAFITLVVLMIEVQWIFKPTFHRLSSQRDHLRSLNSHLTQLNEDLTQAKDEIQHAVEAKENFFSVVTHELRTPLNAIVGVSELLSNSNLDVEQKEHTRVLTFASEHLLCLVNDILDLSKIEAQAIHFEEVPFELDMLVSDLENIFKHKANQSNIYLRVNRSGDIPPYLKGDPVRLRQILTNLINNGLKFTERGGVTLSVHAENLSDDQVQILFDISDTGIGIPEDKHKTIFDAFSQVDASTTRKYGGTGLGLAITKQLVEGQGGKIELTSTPGNGSTFRVCLRYDIVPQEGYPDKNEIKTMNDFHPEKLAGLRLLIAEDEEMNQYVIKKLLKRWGVNFDIVENGYQVLEKMKYDEPYDLILMDFDMPEMNGVEAAMKIRSVDNLYYQQIPIIAITASTLGVIKKTLATSGMNDFIPKPFFSEDLAQIIDTYTSEKVL